MITALIIVVLIVQCIAAGFVLGDRWGWAHNSHERLTMFLMFFGIALFGIPYLILLLVYELIEILLDRISTYFHLRFIWKYIILKRELDYNPEGGKVMDDLAKKLQPKWYDIGPKIFIKINNWVQQKYNV